jgi:predicted SAM-dependent methyltransferase
MFPRRIRALRKERDHWREIAKKVRPFAVYRFIRGSGLEIGALHQPLKLYKGARVRYLDRLSSAELRSLYPELADKNQVDVEIVDDGETLRSVEDASFDFVIASHVVEHCRNPIGALENMLRVVRPGGTIFLAIPDKRFTFDAKRPVTPYNHVANDYVAGPEASDEQHYRESSHDLTQFQDETEGRNRLAEFFARRTNVHFHAWTQREIIELLLNVQRDFGLAFEIEMIARNGAELIIVLRKPPTDEPSGTSQTASGFEVGGRAT